MLPCLSIYLFTSIFWGLRTYVDILQISYFKKPCLMIYIFLIVYQCLCYVLFVLFYFLYSYFGMCFLSGLKMYLLELSRFGIFLVSIFVRKCICLSLVWSCCVDTLGCFCCVEKVCMYDCGVHVISSCVIEFVLWYVYCFICIWYVYECVCVCVFVGGICYCLRYYVIWCYVYALCRFTRLFAMCECVVCGVDFKMKKISHTDHVTKIQINTNDT